MSAPLQLRFVTSAAVADQLPTTGVPEVAVVGRSNVGKSSLINAISNH
ncbi:MAG: GTPase, partial [Microthrixaceae bacterium]